MTATIRPDSPRYAEAVALDVGDVDRRRRPCVVRGKGRGTQTQMLTVSDELVRALDAWLRARGEPPASAPLFVGCSRSVEGERRISTRGVRDVYARLGQAALGRPIHPHALRHAAITDALDATSGDVRRVQRFSRHAKIETLLIYDDARRDEQGQITRLLSERLRAARTASTR